MSEVVLSIEKLSKRYGRIKALDELSLDIEKGNIFGILGPNGSGKTTTLGIVLDTINATSGSFRWFGETPTKNHRKRVGAILESPVFYPYMSATKNLEIIAEIKSTSYDQIPEVLKTVDLFERRNSKFRTYSLGMKQRLAIAAALLGKPEVLILDEPTNGLDPKGISEIRDIIKKISSVGLTLVLASHLLDEVQKVCTHVAILEKGKKLFSGRINEILKETLYVEVSSPDMKALHASLSIFNKVQIVEADDNVIAVKLDEKMDSSELNKYLLEKGISISHISIKKKSLENYFLELLAESHDKTS
ncbi:MAG: ATP-binding cassette domain-containing protein [Bacteroidetes bacterium]|nr:ATP-binding cassette domain-containing protein [Bacteroidota bacterium]